MIDYLDATCRRNGPISDDDERYVTMTSVWRHAVCKTLRAREWKRWVSGYRRPLRRGEADSLALQLLYLMTMRMLRCVMRAGKLTDSQPPIIARNHIRTSTNRNTKIILQEFSIRQLKLQATCDFWIICEHTIDNYKIKFLTHRIKIVLKWPSRSLKVISAGAIR